MISFIVGALTDDLGAQGRRISGREGGQDWGRIAIRLITIFFDAVIMLGILAAGICAIKFLPWYGSVPIMIGSVVISFVYFSVIYAVTGRWDEGSLKDRSYHLSLT